MNRSAVPASLCVYLCCCLLHLLVQFVDDTIRGLLCFSAEAQALLQELRDQVYFTQRKQVITSGSMFVLCWGAREGWRLWGNTCLVHGSR